MKPYYETDSVTIYYGDCLEIMKALPSGSVKAFVTDPPFVFAGGNSNGRSSMVDGQFFSYWWRNVCSLLVSLVDPSGEGFIWCDWRTAHIIAEGFKPKTQTYDYWRVPQMLYHYREMPGQGQPFRNSVDLIAYARGPKSKANRIPNTTHNWISKYWYYGKHKFHEAEKDPAIALQLLEWVSDPGDRLIDPFCGSGPVLISALRTGRQVIGIDNQEQHCETAAKRIEREAAQLKLFPQNHITSSSSGLACSGDLFSGKP